MKRYFLLLLISLFLNFTSFAQSHGDEAGVGFGVQEASHSVNLSSGMLSISVPLGNQVMPMALSYSAGGIKVNQISGQYGLGWNFSAESFISREVRGLADDAENGYSGKNKRGISANSTLTFTSAWNFFNDRLWDSEPDIFRYQFLGYSGAFIINPYRNVVKLTHDNIKIIPYYSDAQGYYSFKIVDPSGNEYYFSTKESLTNQVDTDPQFSYNYKWHLSYVDFYNSTKHLNYSYLTSGSIITTTIDKKGSKIYNSSDPLSITTKSIKNTYYPKLIQKISSGKNSILFEYGSRLDFTNGKRLTAIEIQNNGISYERYELGYEYFENDGTKRLKLKSINKVVPDQPTEKQMVALFHYYGEGINEYILPAYNSHKQDHWGFYNNNPVSTLFEHDGADRSPSLETTKACTIKKVLFPTGKTEEYAFELNSYFDGSNKSAGGLRIANVTIKDESGSENYEKSFEYKIGSSSTGQLYRSPIYIRYFVQRNEINTYERNVHNINSYRALTDLFGRHIIYERVTTTNEDGSSIENSFKTFSDEYSEMPYFPTRYKIRLDYLHDGVITGHTTPLTSNEDTPYGSNSILGMLAGNLESTTYKDNSGNPIREEIYDYQVYNGSSTNYGIAYLLYYNCGRILSRYNEYHLGKYQIKPYYYKLDSKITKQYDTNDANKFISTRTDFSYNSGNYQISSTESYDVGEANGHDIQEIEYLIDNATGINNVTEHNLVNHVKSVTIKKDDLVVASSEKYYDNDAQGDIVVDWERSFTSQGLTSSHKTYSYDNGILVQSHDNIMNQYNSLIFDDEDNKVIATVNNGSKERVAFSSFETGESGNWNLPTLVSGEDCELALQDCQSDCDNSTCEQNCYIAYSNCQGTVNQSNGGKTGDYAFQLSSSNITKTGLPLISYILSYWYKSGSVSISGVSSNTLLSSFSINGWTYNEREIQLSSSTLTISGTALIDELRLYPEEASMSTKTNSYWGPNSETDINNLTAFMDYDSYGRPKYVKDNDLNIIKSFDYNFGRYAFTNAESYAADGAGEDVPIEVFSNTNWSVSDNASWISLSTASGSGDGQFIADCSANGGSTTRNGTITIQSDGISKQLTISQEPGPYISCNTYISFSTYSTSTSFTVSSNIFWTISNIQYVQGGTGWLNFGLTSGTGTKTFTINAYGAPSSGNTWVAEFDVTGSGITKTVTVVYTAY